MTFNYDKFEVLSYHAYPTTVLYELNSYTELFGRATGDKHVQILFENVLKDMDAKHNKYLRDNKVAFKLRHVPTGTILYVGYKDNTYRVGLDITKEGREMKF